MRTKLFSIKFLVLLGILGYTGNIHAQESYDVGEGTGNIYAPIHLFYQTSYTQTIYLASELESLAGKRITKLAYHLQAFSNKDFNDPLRIYIAYTDKNSFEDKDDWEPFSKFEKYYDGRLILSRSSSPQWIEVELDIPFDYTGESNLVIAFEIPEKRGDYKNTHFYASTPEGDNNRTLIAASDSELINVENPYSATDVNKSIPNTRFYFAEISDAPHISVNNRTIDFDYVQITGEPVTQSLTITNTGKEALEITGIENINQPFSVNFSPFSIPYMEQRTIDFSYTPSVGGDDVQEIKLINNSEESSFALTLQGKAYGSTSLFESFEGEVFPAHHWRVTNSKWALSTDAYHKSKSIALGAPPDTLITPLVSGDFSLFAKTANQGKLTLLSSTDLVSWTEVNEVSLTDVYTEYKITLSELAYVGISGENVVVDLIFADNVHYPEKDLLITSWSIPANMREDVNADVTVNLKNWGKSTENAYTIFLKDAVTEETVATIEGLEIAPLEEKQITFSWKPQPEVTHIYAEVKLEGDEDLSNNKSTVVEVSITPHLGNLSSDKTLVDFGVLETAYDTKDMDVTVTNIGIKMLRVSEVQISEPFSTTYEPGTIYEELSQTIGVTFGPAEPGVYEGTLTLIHDGVGGKTEIPLRGEVLKKGQLYEGFNGEEFPPFMWTTVGTGWTRVTNTLFEGTHSVRLYTSQEGSFLITPKLRIEENDEIAFYARSWTTTADVRLEVVISDDLSNWETLAVKTLEDLPNINQYQLVTIPLSEHVGEKYIAFTGIRELLMDLVRGPVVIYPEHDITVKNFSGPTSGVVNSESVYTLTLKNQGEQDEENYLIKFLNGDEVLLTLEGETLPSMVEKEISISWTPRQAGEYTLRVEVELENDELPNNNISSSINVEVAQENSRILQIGEAPGATSSYYPINRLYNYSASQFIYYKDELGLTPGTNIQNIGYPYYIGKSTVTELNIPVRIWVGTTDLETLADGLVQLNDLTLVYDQVHTFEGQATSSNPKTSWFELDEAFVYEEGNIVVLVEANHIESPVGDANQLNFFENTSQKDSRGAYYAHDKVALDMETQLTVENLKNSSGNKYPTILFDCELPGIQVSGTVLDSQNQALSDVEITLTSDNVLYETTSAQDGRFALEVYNLNREYDLKFEKEGYRIATHTFELNSGEDKEVGEVILKADNGRFDITIEVSIATGITVEGTTLELKNNETGMIYDHTFRDQVLKDQVSFNDILGGVFTLTVAKEGYDLLPYINTTLELTSDLLLQIELKENVVTPYGLQTKISYLEEDGTGVVNLTWNNDPDAFFDDFESYDDFEINFSPWTGLDLDKGVPVAMDISYKNAREPQYAIIFNPASTEPVSWGYSAFMPYSGYKYVAFVGVSNVPNNDWLISPKKLVKQGDIVSFMAKAGAFNFAQEEFRVAITETDSPTQYDFTYLSSASRDESVGGVWTNYQYDLSAYAGKEVYVAIQYTSRNKQFLMIDDFYMGQPSSRKSANMRRVSALPITEETTQYPYYVVYLDEQEVETTTNTDYTFKGLAGGEYNVGVKAVYKTQETEIVYTDVVIAGEDEFVPLTITLTTNNGLDVGNVNLVVTNVSEGITYNRTIQDGNSEIKFAKKGDYYIVLNVKGYNEYTATFTLTSEYQLDIVLEEIIVTPGQLHVTTKFNEAGDAIAGTFGWNKEIGFRDGFEDYGNFTTNLSPWTSYDFDDRHAYYFGVGSTLILFPGAGEVQLPFVFNPSYTTPVVSANEEYMAPEGGKYVMFVSPASDEKTYERFYADDWLITPQQTVHQNYQLSFYLKAGEYYEVPDESEIVRILISETTTEVEDFTEIQVINPSNKEWRHYEIDLSEYEGKNIYIAFHYNTFDGMLIQLDDVYVGPKDDVLLDVGAVVEYEVYLNGNLQGKTAELNYTFTRLIPNTTYKAGVKAIYVSGESELAEVEFLTVDYTGIDQIGNHTIQVYPTIVKQGILHVEADELITDIRILNKDGQILKVISGNDVSETVEVKDLLSGVYFIQVTTATQQQIVKIVITP